MGLSAGRLTLTCGFGATLFENDGGTRFGMDGRRPAALIDLPHFPGDQLQDQRTGGDLVVQACSNDPQVAVHAIRNLSRIAFGRAHIRWSQLGFGRTSSTSRAQQTHNGVHMLRRGYNFTDGSDGLGHLDAGLFFIAFVKDPRTHYVPMQRAMARQDTLSVEYLEHTGSGRFAIPPGVKPGGFIGEGLFAT